ncbi:hypothetical protein DB32_006883 [Sandaracinus amylolyticus]|uniref:Uncharacterized protein n=1 Tax=Sandaracinus amylolyticus TaxID=927083 RepID=A0A0F6SH31_9BACT|nr:hypothetical protein DB32_006883 [Sandaracinus amylolyticus]
MPQPPASRATSTRPAARRRWFELIATIGRRPSGRTRDS